MKEIKLPDEFLTIIEVLKSTYTSPNFLPDTGAVVAWWHMLRDIDTKTLQAAVYKYSMINKFPPTVAELREIAAAIKYGDAPDWGQGWENTLQAIRKYGYYNETAALNSLDEITRKTVKRLGWKELCMSENAMADRANFRDIFKQLAQREKESVQLPEGLTALIEGIKEKRVLEEEVQSNDSTRLFGTNKNS